MCHDLFCYLENYQYQVFSKWNTTFQKKLKQVVIHFQKTRKLENLEFLKQNAEATQYIKGNDSVIT